MLTSLDGRSAATVERAHAAGMEDVSPETITTADIILSIVPPGEAVALAEGFVVVLRESRHKPVFIDCNALSPKTKTQVAVTLAQTGCDVIDGAIIGAPPKPGEKGPRLYVSGEQSGRGSVLRALGLDLRQIDGPIGAAAATEDVLCGYHQRPYGNCCRDAAGHNRPTVARPTAVRPTKDSVALKVLFPLVQPRIKEPDECAAFLVESAEVRSFVCVALVTGECEISIVVTSAMLASDDVFDVIGEEWFHVLRKAAVLQR